MIIWCDFISHGAETGISSYHKESLTSCVFIALFVSVGPDWVWLITYVWFHGPAAREEWLFVWTRAHIYPAPRWSRIHGMQRNAISGLELSLITNRWVLHLAHLNITHATHFHIKENTGACTLSRTFSLSITVTAFLFSLQCKHIHSCTQQNYTHTTELKGLFLHWCTALHQTQSPCQKLSHLTRPLPIKIFVCKWSMKQIRVLMATGQAEHLWARVLW